MLYGMTARLGWLGGDPQPMWKCWDELGMQGTEMIGYWDPACHGVDSYPMTKNHKTPANSRE